MHNVEPRRTPQTLRDPLSLLELVPDQLASQETNTSSPHKHDTSHDSAHMENKVSNIIRSLVSRIVIKSDQESAIRSMERNVVESLCEDDFGELRGCQVVMQHSPAGE